MKLSTKVEDLGLSTRAWHSLSNNGIHTIQDAMALSAEELLRLPDFGKVGLSELRAAIKSGGYEIRDYGPAPSMQAAKREPEPEGLRDQIAIRALEMLVGADPRTFLQQVCAPDPAPAVSLANVARLSYAIADAMLVARRG